MSHAPRDALKQRHEVIRKALQARELSLNEQARVVQDVGLASISLFSVIVAVFLGSSLLYKEIERKTLYVILPKPISRAEFLLGKYFGILLTAASMYGCTAAIISMWSRAFISSACTNGSGR